MVLMRQRFFLKRRLFPVSFRASFREVRASGEGCVHSAGRRERWGRQILNEAKALRCGFQTMAPGR